MKAVIREYDYDVDKRGKTDIRGTCNHILVQKRGKTCKHVSLVSVSKHVSSEKRGKICRHVSTLRVGKLTTGQCRG